MGATETEANSTRSGEISRDDLKSRTLEGVRWVAIARGIAEVAMLASGIVLAHLVTPAEFGRLAVGVVISELALAVAAESVGTPLVQRKELTRAHVEASAMLGMVAGVVLMLVTLGLAAVIVVPVFGTRTAELVALFSPTFLLAGFRMVPQALLQRKLDFRRLSVIEVVATIVGASVSVGLAAVAGFEAEAYIFGILTSGAVSVILLCLAARPPLPRWRPAESRTLLGFGGPAGIAGLLWIANRNCDYAILGIRLSPVQVGYYYRAFSLGVENEQRISGIVSRVLFPVYSRTHDLAHLRSLRARVMRANTAIVFPVLAGFAAVAPLLVPWVFGPRWEPAVLPAQILAIGGMAATVGFGNGALMLAAGRPRALAVFNAFQLVGYASTVAVAAAFGLTAVCVAVASFQVAAVLCSYEFLLKPCVGVGLVQLGRDVRPAIGASIAVAVAAAAVVSTLDGAGAPALATLAAAVAAGGMAYALVLRSAFGEAWADLSMLVRGVIRRRSGQDRSPQVRVPPQPETAAMGGS